MGVREHRPGAYRHVLLGVSGGIAAYKACEVVRRLRGAGGRGGQAGGGGGQKTAAGYVVHGEAPWVPKENITT